MTRPAPRRHQGGLVHQVLQVASDLLFVNVEVGGEFLDMVFERHRPEIREGY